MNDQFTPDEQFIPDSPAPGEDVVLAEAVNSANETASGSVSETEDFVTEEPAEASGVTTLQTSADFSVDDIVLSPEELPAPETSDENVTQIILDTLAEQALDGNTDIEPLTSEQADLLLDGLNSTPILPVEEIPVPAGIDSDLIPAQEAADEPEETEEVPAPMPKKERPVRKGRPKRRPGSGLLSIPHLLSAAIWLLIIVAIGVSLGRTIWVCAADVLAFGRESKEVTISITADDTMETIADKLHDAGLINIPDLFLFYAKLTDVEAENKITTGTFTLNTIYDYMALVSHMGPRATNRAVVEDVLIPEGYNCRQIFALLEEKGICKAADLEAYAASGELDDYWFLEGVPRGDKYCLEGFLFPDTYDFYENSTPRLALEKMLDGFQYRFSQDLRDQIPVLNERLTEMMRRNGDSDEFIAENQLSLRDVLTVASLIEEETSGTSESYRIASVIFNRLFSWGDTPRYLNIDATIIYALEGKTNLTTEDMAVDSPYNTYTHTGLTPGPISNPGLASIQAVLNFEDTSFYYYVLNPATGEHQFSRTYAEHSEWVEKFREAQNNG